MILRKAKRFNLLHLRCIEMYPYESPPPSLHCHGSGGGGLVAMNLPARLALQGDRWALMRMFSGLNEGNCLYQRL